MASAQRKMAADARRLATSQADGEKEATARIREALRKAFQNGVESGRAQERSENSGQNARALLLDGGADALDQLAARTSAIPNSDRAMSAFREAASILRDAARRGEPAVAEDEAETKPKSKAKSAAKKSRSNGQGG